MNDTNKINLSSYKKGDKLTITHCRKGTFDAEVLTNKEGEWMNVIILSKKVNGLVNTWIQGEELGIRKSFITKITPIS